MRIRQGESQGKEDKFRGLYIAEREVEALLATPPSNNVSLTGSNKPDLIALAESIKQVEADIGDKKRVSLCRGLPLRLNELKRSFNLSKFELDVLLVSLLPELDLKYQRLFAYLQDDVTKKNPTVDLVLNLLGESLGDRLMAREAFSREAPLLKYYLLHLHDGHLPYGASFLAKSVQVDERIASYLLGSDRIDARLLSFSQLCHPKVTLSDVVVPDEIKQPLSSLAARFTTEGLILHFQGSYGTGRRMVAEAICHNIEIPLLVVDVSSMAAASIPLELSLPLVFREARLQKAALYLETVDTLLGGGEETRPGHGNLIRELESHSGWIFLAGETTWQPKGVLSGKTMIHVEFPLPSYSDRKRLWDGNWNGRSALASGVDFGELAGKFRLSGGQINDAAALARSLALWRDAEGGLVNNQDLYSACRQQTGQKLSTLAYKINPKYHWDDIVLPKDQMEQLHEICAYVKHYHTVYDGWGFGRRVSLGKGLNVLFAGPSGTGKTMAADIMANELGLDLYKVDLSAIVSKYIGETEKNLDRIFREGKATNAILFFDEADALFGKRSEVRDSHDRYANIEIAYLLQKMEEYEGVVILATNLRKNMDEAFARRMHFSVEFPVPEEADRCRIWQSIFPGEAPLGSDVDLSFMARQFKISGGNIKNIALGAAFLAAQDGGSITMESLIRATKREYQKVGKLCTEGDFAQYFELVKG
jgi:ATP-dependent 26S proteasome regulatory subunit